MPPTTPPSPPPPDLRAATDGLDGPMVDTLGDFVVALNAMLAELKLPALERGFVEHTIGKGSEHLIRSTLAHLKAPASLYEAAWEGYQRHYLAINGQHAQVFPGVVEGLQRLVDRGWSLVCLTNKPTAFAMPLLQQKGLSRFFKAAFGGGAFERKKPDPLPLLKACEALDTLPARVLMIGDSSNDAQAARAAGCPVVLVTYAYNHGEPIHAVPADGYLDRLDQLLLD